MYTCSLKPPTFHVSFCVQVIREIRESFPLYSIDVGFSNYELIILFQIWHNRRRLCYIMLRLLYAMT